jgi:hypothetical protein
MGRPLPLRRLVSSGAEVQVDPAALDLGLVELALAVVLAGGLEQFERGVISFLVGKARTA